MNGPRLAVLGSANMDLVASADHLPTAGETVLGGNFATIAGGKGANQAVAASRAGGNCVMIAAVGDDSFGPLLRAGLEASEIDTRLVRVADGPSGVALIAVDRDGENQILVAPGANAALVKLTDDELAAVTGAQALVCQLETPLSAIVQAAQAASRADVAVILNAAPARQLPPELLDEVDMLIVNQGEAEVVSGRPGASVDELLSALLERVPRVAVTLGAAGAAYADREGLRLDVPAPVIEAVDTTAAGDAFVGALTVAWLDGWPIRDALRFGCAAGAACARTYGAADSLPTRAEIDELFAQAYES